MSLLSMLERLRGIDAHFKPSCKLESLRAGNKIKRLL
jgi:hypothetical protein